MLEGDSRAVLTALRARLGQLSAAERYEEAQTLRDRMLALVRATARWQRLSPLAAIPQLVAARRRDAGGWEVVCVRFGRLAGTTVTPPGADPMPYIDALCTGAEVVAAPGGPAPAAYPEETELVLRWLETAGTRIVELEGCWTCPVGGAGMARAELEPMARQWSEPVEDWSAPTRRPLERPPGAVPALAG